MPWQLFLMEPPWAAAPEMPLWSQWARRFSRLPIGLVRGILEGTVLLLGWLMGAKVGIGTIIAVFGIGTTMEYTFRILKFDVKGVRHENFCRHRKADKIRPTYR